MKIVTITGCYNCFIAFYCSVLFYLIPCHVLSIMMFKCTLMKEQINFLKIKINQNQINIINFQTRKITYQGKEFVNFFSEY